MKIFKNLFVKAIAVIAFSAMAFTGCEQHPDYDQEVAGYEMQITDLNKKVSDLKKQIETLQKENKELTEKKQDLTKQLEQSKNDYETLDVECKKYKSDYESTLAELEKLKKQIEELQKKLDAEETAHKITKDEKTQLENKLKETIENLSMAEEKIQSLEAEIKTLKERIEELTANVQNLKDEISELNSTVKELNETITSTEAEKAQLKTELDVAKEDLKTKQSDLASANAKILELQNALDDEEAAHKITKDEKTQLQSELDQTKDTLTQTQSELAAANQTIQELNAQISSLNDKITELKKRYVNPLQFDVYNISGIAVTGKAASNARFAVALEEDTNLVVIKEDGSTESAIVIGTEDNAGLTEAAGIEDDAGSGTPEEPEYIYEYVSPENNQIAKIVKTVQCTYELNDKEASGYYIVFDGKSTFTYADETSKSTGSLIYVTPDGEERDVFGSADVDLDTKIDYEKIARDGGSLILFDENGNAFFVTENKKLYRYQPVANKLDELTPSDAGSGIENFSVSIDGKYVVFSCEENDKKVVKALKIADKSVNTIYTSQIHAKCSAVRSIVYMDKNHSFYFPTNSYLVDCEEHVHGVDNAVHRWSYETGKLDSVKYTSDSPYYNSELPGNKDPGEGETELIVTAEGIFAMMTNESEIDERGYWKAWKNTILVKLFDENGDFIKCEIPTSLKGMVFAAPSIWQNKEDVVVDDPATWYKPAFLSNGKGIAVVGSDSTKIYYYEGKVLKDLLAFDTDRLNDISMSLSDKLIIFNAKKKGVAYTKSINLENGEIRDISINNTVLNILAVKGATIKDDDESSVKLQLSVKISEQNDLRVENKSTDSKLILEAAEGYSDYTWSCNGFVLATERRVFEKENINTWEKGFYPIYVTAKKNGLVYSCFIEVEVK